MTAFQPPPPSPTHSVNPDHSAFGTTTSHAENRTTDPPYGRRPDWRERVLVSACGQEIFIGGDPNHVASAATATREYAAATATTNTPCPTSLCRPTRARPLAVPLHPHTTPASTAPPTRPAPITTMVQTLPHTPSLLHILCPPASCLPHNTMVQTGRHPNELRLWFLVRYISMNSDPHPPSSFTQTPPSHAPTGPSSIQPKHPRTHLPPNQLHPRD